MKTLPFRSSIIRDGGRMGSLGEKMQSKLKKLHLKIPSGSPNTGEPGNSTGLYHWESLLTFRRAISLFVHNTKDCQILNNLRLASGPARWQQDIKIAFSNSNSQHKHHFEQLYMYEYILTGAKKARQDRKQTKKTHELKRIAKTSSYYPHHLQRLPTQNLGK